MVLSDYLNGPTYRRRVQVLESQMAELQERYAQMQALAKKYGVMEVFEVQTLQRRHDLQCGAWSRCWTKPTTYRPCLRHTALIDTCEAHALSA